MASLKHLQLAVGHLSPEVFYFLPTSSVTSFFCPILNGRLSVGLVFDTHPTPAHPLCFPVFCHQMGSILCEVLRKDSGSLYACIEIPVELQDGKAANLMPITVI